LYCRSTVDTTIEGRFERSYNTSPIKQETAAMTLTIEPLERGSGNVIEIDSMATSSFPEVSKKLKNEVTQAVRAGLEDALRSGVPAGFPLQDVSISVSDIEYVTGTTAHVYNICAIQAVWELVKTKGVRLMEPIMEVVLTVDELVRIFSAFIYPRHYQ
jgi:elongation factor G